MNLLKPFLMVLLSFFYLNGQAQVFQTIPILLNPNSHTQLLQDDSLPNNFSVLQTNNLYLIEDLNLISVAHLHALKSFSTGVRYTLLTNKNVKEHQWNIFLSKRLFSNITAELSTILENRYFHQNELESETKVIPALRVLYKANSKLLFANQFSVFKTLSNSNYQSFPNFLFSFLYSVQQNFKVALDFGYNSFNHYLFNLGFLYYYSDNAFAILSANPLSDSVSLLFGFDFVKYNLNLRLNYHTELDASPGIAFNKKW